ncbi:MAG: lycopene cyclase domain-containing protein [Actinomycetota bacterium]|nr:lycopene cyclase domain-containing protein [Actinomycetota bacterium]
MSYTVAAVVGVAATVALDLLVLRTRLVTRRSFWTAYAIVLFFQLVVNGVLTGRRIVTYDGAAILGSATPRLLGDGRIAYAPVEDLLFGFALVTQTLCWWVWLGRRQNRVTSRR